MDACFKFSMEFHANRLCSIALDEMEKVERLREQRSIERLSTTEIGRDSPAGGPGMCKDDSGQATH